MKKDEAQYAEARKQWQEFGNIPLTDNDEIDEPFMGFERGTCRFDIFHWFEDTYNVSVAEDLMTLSNN